MSAGSWGGVHFGQNAQYANDVIGYDSTATTISPTFQFNHMVMLIPFQNVNLTSSDFGMMIQSQDTSGETNILRWIPISCMGQLTNKSEMNITCGWVDVNGTRLDTMSLQLRQQYGRLCVMRGLHISSDI
ncbi:hypothetical protein N9L68_02980 [bacterium]|nr:hypothetical protein [bacterium]